MLNSNTQSRLILIDSNLQTKVNSVVDYTCPYLPNQPYALLGTPPQSGTLHFSCSKSLVAFMYPLMSENQFFAITNQGIKLQTYLANYLDPDGHLHGYLLNLHCRDAEFKLTEGREVGLLVIRLIRTLQGFVRHHAQAHRVMSYLPGYPLWHHD